MHSDSTVRRIGPALGRVAASLGMIAVGIHVALAIREPSLMSLVMLLAALTCAVCAVAAWHGPTARDWFVIGLVNAAMLVLHAPISPAGGLEHPHGLAHGIQHLQGRAWDLAHAAGLVVLAETAVAVVALASHYRSALTRCSPGRQPTPTAQKAGRACPDSP